MVPLISFLTFVYIANSTVLDSAYFVDTTLTVADSPYYVNYDVTIKEGVTLIIENGVDIEFSSAASADIYIRGTLIVGCNSIDTSTIHHRGLADNITYTYIHAPTSYLSSIRIDPNDVTGIILNVQFCNVLFEYSDANNGGYSIVYWNGGYGVDNEGSFVLFDNCEFKAKVSTAAETSQYTDSIIHSNGGGGIDIHGGRSTKSALVNNCLFDGGSASFYSLGPIYFYNSDITRISAKYKYGITVTYCDNTFIFIENVTINNNNYGQYGIYIKESDNIKISNTQIFNSRFGGILIDGGNSRVDIFYNEISNDIIDGQIGINIKGLVIANITYNNISNQQTGIRFSDSYPNSYGESSVHYNNFININTSIDNNVDHNHDASLNYFGSSSTNQAIVASGIKDICDEYGNGLVTFWPFIINPVNINNYKNSNNGYEMCTFDFIGCKSYTEASSNCYNYTATSEPLTTLTTSITTTSIRYPTRWPTRISVTTPSPTRRSMSDTGKPTSMRTTDQQSAGGGTNDNGELNIREIILIIFVVLLLVIITIGSIYCYINNKRYKKQVEQLQVQMQNESNPHVTNTMDQQLIMSKQGY